MLKPAIFREYDIRGIADTELLSPAVAVLGQAIGTYLARRAGGKITLGRDCRRSSARLVAAIRRGLLASGCDVVDLGIVPTPLLYYSVFHLDADGAVMITGSHNPPEYNGFKIVCGSATIYGAEIQKLRTMIESGDLAIGAGVSSTADMITPYVEEIASLFGFARRVKVAFDAGNGTAGPVVRRLLRKLDCDAVELFFEMDGNFPNHHPDPTVPENLKPLIAAVAQHGAELGIAFDGDADRIGAIDENGAMIWGDQLLLIYAREILGRKPGATFIGEVKCSQVLYDELRRLGGNAVMYRTGHSLIKAKMKQVHAELAGLPKMVSTPEIRVDCADETKFEVVRRVMRVSHTQPALVLRFEAVTPELLTGYRKEVEGVLASVQAEVEDARLVHG